MHALAALADGDGVAGPYPKVGRILSSRSIIACREGSRPRHRRADFSRGFVARDQGVDHTRCRERQVGWTEGAGVGEPRGDDAGQGGPSDFESGEVDGCFRNVERRVQHAERDVTPLRGVFSRAALDGGNGEARMRDTVPNDIW